MELFQRRLRTTSGLLSTSTCSTFRAAFSLFEMTTKEKSDPAADATIVLMVFATRSTSEVPMTPPAAMALE